MKWFTIYSWRKWLAFTTSQMRDKAKRSSVVPPLVLSFASLRNRVFTTLDQADLHLCPTDLADRMIATAIRLTSTCMSVYGRSSMDRYSTVQCYGSAALQIPTRVFINE